MNIYFPVNNFGLIMGPFIQEEIILNELIKRGVNIVSDLKNADLMHTNNLCLTSTFQTLRAKKLGVKTIITGHSSSTPNSKVWSLPQSFFDFLFPRWYNLFDKVIAVSKTSHDYLKSIGVPEDKLLMNPIGINLDKFKFSNKLRKEMRNEMGFKDNDKVILSIGHLSPLKGVYLFNELINSMPDCKFLWIGSYPVPSKLRHLTKDYRKINQIIKSRRDVFIGKVSYDDMPKFMSGADILLSLSDYETFGMAVLEGLACNINVITKPLPVFKELYGSKIKYASNTKEFTDSIRKLKIKRNSVNRILALKFDYRKHVNNLLKIYDSVINE